MPALEWVLSEGPLVARWDRTSIGMRVELPRLLSVLSHELRSPLSVLQGYLRLMLQQGATDDANRRMLQAMLDATGRLTTIGRQAADLAPWTTASPRAAADTVSLGALLDAAARGQTGVSVEITGPVRDELIATADKQALEAALGALIAAARRDLPREAGLAVRASPGAGAELRVHIGTPDATPDEAEPGRPLAFDRGGLGLALVLASYVLDAHGAEVTETAPGSILIRLHKTGGGFQ